MPMLDAQQQRLPGPMAWMPNYEIAGMDARKLFGDYLGIAAEETIVVGSSS